MKNRDVFLKDPLDPQNRLVNQGVAEVVDPRTEQELRTLRYELETFVCEGQYARGIERILDAYLAHLNREEQPAVWVSGFYGSGKSHLVKMLRFLWTDFRFPDGATARGIAQLPNEIRALLQELSTEGKRHGGLHAAGGKLGSGAGDSIRLALLGIVFRSAGLPEDYAAARFVLFLKKNGYLEAVKRHVEAAGRDFERELAELYVSPLLAKAILEVDPTFAPSEKEVRAQIKAQFPRPNEISDAEMIAALEDVLVSEGQFPCTLIVLDEVQQFIGDSSERAYKLQEVAEVCSKHFGARLLFVGTGQSAITGTPQLEKLQARFRISVELSDADVDTVIRRIVLAKKPDKEPAIREVLEKCSGEISRHLQGTKLAPRPEDREVLVADYPLLPVRRRFWEQAMRAIDPSGTRAELRNQLITVFEAVKATAEKPLGTVVPADFVYDENKTQMVQTGVLLREFQEMIDRLDDGTEEGRLKSRLCALCFLIGKFPRESAADVGLRATPDTLADLLVEDLRAGSAELRKQIPRLLEELVEEGKLISVSGEYRLQTRESAAWESEYRSRLSRIRNDTVALASERAELLRTRVRDALRGLRIPHGQSKVIRKVEVYFERPPAEGPAIPVWVRDGWNDDENSVLADARAAGPESPLTILFLPRRNPEDLKKLIASTKAAQETLNARGTPSTTEGIEARKAMETRLKEAELKRDALLDEILGHARVILAGGAEKTGQNLVEKVRDAAQDAIRRLYTRFDDGDSPAWPAAYERARKGDLNALEAVGHNGSPEDHAVCREILAFVAGGKKGKEIRKQFMAPPFGWSQDAIDAALIVLVGSGHLRARLNGKALSQKDLNHSNIGVVDFRLETKTITTHQRLALRKLFQAVGVPAKPNEEAAAARQFLEKMKDLARSARGEPPLPAPPSTAKLEELLNLMGNEQLAAIYEMRDELTRWAEEWQGQAKLAQRRLPRWQLLEELYRYARSLPAAAEVGTQMKALREHRSLLSEPDPVEPLIKQVAQALREALQKARSEYVDLYQRKKKELAANESWKELAPEEQTEILDRYDLSSVPEFQAGTEEELLRSLEEISLEEWATRRDALPERFKKALEEAQRRQEPEAVSVTVPPPPTTLHDEEELLSWIREVEAKLREALKRGPVIVRWE